MRDNLAQKTEVNMLYDFYQPLLTKKQDLYMQLYYGDDYSLGEIADNYHVSRQAVYDNLKRTVKLLQSYEDKLHLYHNFVQREQLLTQLKKTVEQENYDNQVLLNIIKQLSELE